VVTPRTGTIEYTHQLVLRDFETMIKDYSTGKQIICDTFQVPLKYKSLPCHIQVYPSGQTDKVKDSLSLFLHCKVTDDMDFKIWHECRIISAEEDKECILSQAKERDSSKYKKLGYGYNLIKHSDLFDPSNKFLNQGSLKLIFKITIKQKDAVMKSTTSVKKGDETNKHLLSVMQKLLEDPIGNRSDFIIECMDKKEVHCHSHLLVAASEYFQNMFATNSQESQEGRVFIRDLKKETCEVIMKYIYTGELDVKQATLDLYKQANYLRLIELRDLCSNYLVNNLTTENCVDVIVLADGIKDKALKEACADFIEENSKNIDLKKINDFDLLVELYQRKSN